MTLENTIVRKNTATAQTWNGGVGVNKYGVIQAIGSTSLMENSPRQGCKTDADGRWGRWNGTLGASEMGAGESFKDEPLCVPCDPGKFAKKDSTSSKECIPCKGRFFRVSCSTHKNV